MVLMGDAAHPMPSLGGVGANAAWQDICNLFSALSLVQPGQGDSKRIEAVAAYEATRFARATIEVEWSAGGARQLLRMRPIEELKGAEWLR